MKLHPPSVLHYLRTKLDLSFDIFAHNWTIYVYCSQPYFTSRMMQEVIIEAITDALDAPLAAPDGPRRRSVLDAPLGTHLDALAAALSDRCDYLQKRAVLTQEGGRGLEYRIDVKVLRAIMIEVRQTQDRELTKRLIAGEVFVSERLLEKRFLRFTGIAISNRRARFILKDLENEGVIKSNGNLRTAGREVIAWE